MRESHEHLQTIHDEMVEGLLITDIESKRFTRVNASLCRMLGYSEEELLAASIKDIHPPEEVSNDLQRFQAAAEGRVSINEDRPVLRKDGSVFYADITGRRILYKQRPCLLALFRNVTERRAAEEALRRSEERFRSYFVQGLVGMAVTRSDRQWQEVNDRLCEILGYSRDELLGMKWTDATHPDDLDIGLSLFNRMIAGEIDHYAYEKRFIRKDGKIVYATMFIRCFRRKDKTIDHILALIEDTTDRRQAERALKERSDVLQQYTVQLARINERLRNEDQHLRNLMELQDRDRQLIGFEIHDELAQLLTGAMMYLEGFQCRQESKPADTWGDFDAGLALLAKGIREARRLINGLRPPSLDEAGVLHAIQDLAHEVQSREQPQIEFVANVEFHRLPQPLENTIFRIVQESLLNACRHSKSEHVRIELRQEGGRLIIEVRDWGSGFDPQSVAEGRFGLKSVRERARVFGGQATIESRPGEGTRITVELPLLER